MILNFFVKVEPSRLLMVAKLNLKTHILKKYFLGDFLFFCYYIQHCFICCHSVSTVLTRSQNFGFLELFRPHLAFKLAQKLKNAKQYLLLKKLNMGTKNAEFHADFKSVEWFHKKSHKKVYKNIFYKCVLEFNMAIINGLGEPSC